MENNNNVVQLRRAFQCVACGSSNGNIRTEQIAFDYTQGESVVELTVEVPVETCRDCGERVQGAEAEKIRHERVCQYLGVLTPEEVRNVRGSLGLSREEMSDLTGIGSASIARWELGTLIQNRAYDHYVRLLRLPGTREKLETLTGNLRHPTNLPDLQCLVTDDNVLNRAARYRFN